MFPAYPQHATRPSDVIAQVVEAQVEIDTTFDRPATSELGGLYTSVVRPARQTAVNQSLRGGTVFLTVANLACTIRSPAPDPTRCR